MRSSDGQAVLDARKELEYAGYGLLDIFPVFHFLSAASKCVICLLCAEYRGTIVIDYKRKDSIEERTVVTMAHLERTWGVRSGHAAQIAENVVQSLKEHPQIIRVGGSSGCDAEKSGGNG